MDEPEIKELGPSCVLSDLESRIGMSLVGWLAGLLIHTLFYLLPLSHRILNLSRTDR